MKLKCKKIALALLLCSLTATAACAYNPFADDSSIDSSSVAESSTDSVPLSSSDIQEVIPQSSATAESSSVEVNSESVTSEESSSTIESCESASSEESSSIEDSESTPEESSSSVENSVAESSSSSRGEIELPEDKFN